VRSLAALKLVEVADGPDLGAMLDAWLVEGDSCTKGNIEFAIQLLLPQFAVDPSERPSGQQRVAPFKPCVPSEPALLSLSIEQVRDTAAVIPLLRVSVRNETGKTLPFVEPATSPGDYFSVNVLGPDGKIAPVKKGEEWMYSPPRTLDGVFGRMGMFVPLAPGETVTWNWPVGRDFEMSTPGTYRVSFGGRVRYLGITAGRTRSTPIPATTRSGSLLTSRLTRPPVSQTR
jgi:hypothetical protein